MKQTLFAVGVMAGVLIQIACGTGGEAKAPTKEDPPAKVTAKQKEADLATVHLTEQAANRLGVETAEVKIQQLRAERQLAGDAVLPPGKALIVTAPVGGTLERGDLDVFVGQPVRAGQILFRLTPLLPLQRDLRATYEADLTAAKARLDTTQLQVDRAQQLLRDGAGSQRNVELAQQDYAQAKAAFDAADQRLKRLETHPLESDVALTLTAPVAGMVRQVLSSPGQQVSGGASIVEVANLSTMWIRVPVYVGDLQEISAAATVPIDNLDPGLPDLLKTARRVSAPPTADPLAATADLYFEVDNSDGVLRPGQKVGVRLPLRSSGEGLAVPASAIVYDAQGGAWVYVETAPLTYQRRRVDVVRTVGNTTQLARGVETGQKVVTAGVVELFGTEFGAGK